MTARTLVWGHGLTSSMAHEDRRGLFAWEVPDGWDLVRYDAAGHGTSDVDDRDPERYRWERLAADMLSRAPERAVVLGGASMGAATALHAAVLQPERVEALLLVIPPTAWETRAAQRELYEGAAHVAEAYGRARLQEMVAQRPSPRIFEDRPDLTVYDPAIADDLLPTVLRGAAASDLPPPEVVAQLAMPALVLAWDTDPGHPLATAEALDALLPASRLHVARTLTDVESWPTIVRAFLTALA